MSKTPPTREIYRKLVKKIKFSLLRILVGLLYNIEQ